jgi:spore maturation protein A
MRIAESGGVIEALSRRMEPFLNFLFPHIPKSHPARKYIASNMAANIFGLGWAATPAGLKAMKALQELNRADSNIATPEMCTFLIINISSLQLIPVSIIAYRSQYGSVNPAAIIGPGLVATLCSTLAAVIFCRIMQRK